MKSRASVLQDPFPLLFRFAVVAGVLFLLRAQVFQLYLAVSVPLVNGLFQLDGVAVEFVRNHDSLQLVYKGLGYQFTVNDIIYQNLMVAVALFAATPGSLRWRAKWIAIVLAALWITHMASLYMGGYVIIWDYVESLPQDQKGQIAQQILQVFPRDRDWLFSHLFGIWHTWGRPTMGLVIWLFAAREYLGLPGNEEEGDRYAASSVRGEPIGI